MKIIIIGPAYPLRGGIADTNESLCRALGKANHQASIYSYSLQYPEFLFPGKTQYSSDPAPMHTPIKTVINSINPFNWIKVANAINKEKPEVVIVRYWLPFLAPCLGTILRLLHKKIKVIAITDNVIPHEKRIGDTFFTRYFIGGCDGFLTLSSTVEEELKTFTTKPTAYFPHPINDNFGELVDNVEAKEKLHLQKEASYVLFFGLVRKYKGLDLLLDAWADSRIQSLGLQLLVVGEFYEGKEEYLTQIERLGINSSVQIEDRFIATDEIKYYFSATDLVAQTYHSASQSGITQIAYHFNCPMLVTNVGALSEIVLHEKVGYVVEKNPLEIANAIVRFFEEKKANEFIAHIKHEKLKFSWEALIDTLIAMGENIQKPR